MYIYIIYNYIYIYLILCLTFPFEFTEGITSVLYPHHDLELRAHAWNIGANKRLSLHKEQIKYTRDVLGLES